MVNLLFLHFNGKGSIIGSRNWLQQQIAIEGIHAERMIQRLKCYHIFERVFPQRLAPLTNLLQFVLYCVTFKTLS